MNLESIRQHSRLLDPALLQCDNWLVHVGINLCQAASCSLVLFPDGWASADRSQSCLRSVCRNWGKPDDVYHYRVAAKQLHIGKLILSFQFSILTLLPHPSLDFDFYCAESHARIKPPYLFECTHMFTCAPISLWRDLARIVALHPHPSAAKLVM